MLFETRDYQEKSYNAVKESLRQGNRKIVLSMPTGSGKSHVAIKMIKEALRRRKRVCFLCDRIILLEQISNMIYNEDIKEFSLMQANNELYSSSAQLQIATAQTLIRREIEPFDLCIYDECHIVYKSITDLMKKWDSTFWIGLTATPFTVGMGKNWQTLVNGTSTFELIEQGYLSKYIAYGPSTPDLKGIRITAGDYNKKDLAQKVNKKTIIGDLLTHWIKLALNRKTVIGAVNVAHATQIMEIFKEAGVLIEVIHCYMQKDEIKDILEKFKNNEIQVLSSVDLVSRGFDMPDVNCIVIARPTKSLNYHLQFIGRGLRSAPNKENCLILDHSGNFARLGFPDDNFEMELDMGDKKQNKKKEKKEKLPKPCPKCSFLTIEWKCPQCGFEKKKQSNVETKEGELKELQKKNHKEKTFEQKKKLWAKLEAAGRAANFKPKYADAVYKNMFGVWPKDVKKEGMNKEFYNWLITQPRRKITQIAIGLAKK